MKKILVTALLTTSLLPTLTTAQEASTVPEMAAFSNCLKAAVDAERADTVSEGSLDRVKRACASQQRALIRVMPPSVAQQIIGLLDESLLRELHRN